MPRAFFLFSINKDIILKPSVGSDRVMASLTIPSGIPVSEQIAFFHLRPTLLIAVPAVLLTLSTICVCLRFYVRAVMIKSFGVDDWLLLLAFCFHVVGAAFNIDQGAMEMSSGLEDLRALVIVWLFHPSNRCSSI